MPCARLRSYHATWVGMRSSEGVCIFENLQAFRAAKEATAAATAIASGRAQSGMPGADEREVSRVLSARDDYQVSKLLGHS